MKKTSIFTRNPELTTFFLIFVASLVIRFAFFILWVNQRPEIFQNPNSFEGNELGWVAVNLYEGRGFSSPLERGSAPTAFFSPLIPFLWAGLMSLTAGPSGKTAFLIVLINVVISALAVSFYYLCAKRIENRSPSKLKGLGLAAAFVLMLWPESILRNYDLWYYVWQEAGVALLVITGMLWVDQPTPKHAVFLGLAAGFNANINPTPLPLYFMILIVPMIYQKFRTWSSARTILLSLLIAAALILPWTIRNFIVFGRFIPMRSNYGIELRQGNNPYGSIRQNGFSLNPYIVQEELDSFRALGEVQYSQQAMKEAFAYISENPLITGTRIVKRAYVLWFSDITDRWSWFPDNLQTKWWNGNLFVKLLAITTALSAILPLMIVLVGLVGKKFNDLPYKSIFLGIFTFMTLPYYFTSAGVVYTQVVRTWLAFLGTIVIFKAWGFAKKSYRQPVLTSVPPDSSRTRTKILSVQGSRNIYFFNRLTSGATNLDSANGFTPNLKHSSKEVL